MPKKIVNFVLLVSLILAVGLGYCLNLDKLKVYFLEGDYKSAIVEGEKIMAVAGRSPNLDELYYILGLSYLKDGNYLRASDIFEIILNEFKESEFKEAAKLGLADTYFLRGDFSKAQDYYQDLMRSNPQTKLKAQVYYRLSKVNLERQDTQTAKEYLEKIKNEFPLNTELISKKDSYGLPDSAADFYYSVQVGSFASSANASNLAQTLKEKGYASYVEEVDLKDKKTFRVKIGKFKSRLEASQLTDKLSRDGYPTKICP